jgi:hypothetical protein
LSRKEKNFTVQGGKMTVVQMYEETGADYSSIYWRMKHWPEDRWLEPRSQQVSTPRRPARHKNRPSFVRWVSLGGKVLNDNLFRNATRMDAFRDKRYQRTF